MKCDVLDIHKKVVGSVDLKDSIFSVPSNGHVVYEVVKNVLANKRQGTSSTLTRSEVNGSTRKPWKQKGTGRARVGSTKSPLWRGKAILFGPKPRDYSYSVNRKTRKLGYMSVLSDLMRANKLLVLEDFSMPDFSTKKMVEILSGITSMKKVLLVLNSDNRSDYEKMYTSSKNIAVVKVVNVHSLDIKELFYADEVVFLRSAIEKINGRYL